MLLTTETVTSAETWTTLLHQLPNPHPLQSWAWGELKSRWGWTMHPTIWRDGTQVVAAAMALRRPIPHTPWGFLYLPRGPVISFDDAALRTAILPQLAQLGRAHHAIALKIDPDLAWGVGNDEAEISPQPTGIAFLEALKAHGWHFSAEQIQFRNTITLDLTQSEEALLAAMKNKTRYNIRLASKKEVVVRHGTPADFPLVVQMYTQTGERNQFALRSADYYLDVWRTFHQAGQLQMLIAEYQGQPLAAVVLVHFGRLCLYMYGASGEEERARMPTYLLQWEAIRWAKANGCTLYDFWGAPDHFVESDRLWGVWNFKRGFQGTIQRGLGAWDLPINTPLYTLYNHLPRLKKSLVRLRTSEKTVIQR